MFYQAEETETTENAISARKLSARKLSAVEIPFSVVSELTFYPYCLLQLKTGKGVTKNNVSGYALPLRPCYYFLIPSLSINARYLSISFFFK